MGLWQGVLVVLGCLAAGFLVGIVLLRVLRHTKKRDYSLYNQEAKTIKAANAALPVTAISKEINKSNGHEDPLEILLKNHKNGLNAENPKPLVPTDNPVNTAITSLKKETVVEKEGKPAQPAIHWTELYPSIKQLTKDEDRKPNEQPVVKEPVAVSQKNNAPVVKEPVATNQTSAPVAAEPPKATLNAVKEAEIVIQMPPPPEEKPKKVSKSVGPKKPETTTPKNPPDVKDKKKSAGLPVPEPGISKQESISRKSAEPQTPELVNAAQKITPVQEKPEGALKSDLVMEMEYNLAIASWPTMDKLVPFQTKCWDSKHGETDLFMNSHYREVIQLYVDIGLANNIVWLATEINHRSKELDESYLRLCAGITEILDKILT